MSNELRAGRKTTSRFPPVVAITLRVMGPRKAEETTAFGLITRSVMNTFRNLFFGRP